MARTQYSKMLKFLNLDAINCSPNRRISYPIQEEPLVFSKAVFDLFLKEGNFINLMGLYSFYYYTAKWQNTTQPKATTKYVAKGVGWGEDKVTIIKTKLKNLGLIEDIVQRDHNGRIIGYYIKLNFISTSAGVLPVQAKSDLNTLNPNKRKILLVDDDKISPLLGYITPNMFEKFWKIYPRKDSKGSALTKWNTICRKGNKRPTWIQIKQAIIDQKKSERWSNPEFIPLSSTWLNQSRWLDDPKELKKFSRKTDKKPFIVDDGIKYHLCEDGEYRTKRKGTLYIP